MKGMTPVRAFALAAASVGLLGGCSIIIEPPDPPEPCEVDEDCEEGEVCYHYEVCPACVYDDPPCAAPCVLQGVCVDEPAPEVCYDDSDCPEGFFCEYDDCVSPVCPPGQDCPAACQPVGHCAPVLPDCYELTLEQCVNDERCRIAPVPTDCLYLDEADGARMPEEDVMPWPCEEVVPGCLDVDEPLTWPACLSDADCGDGSYTCAYIDCLPYPCDPGEPCPELCQPYGVCRYQAPPPTCDGFGCPEGQHCELVEVCWAGCGLDPGYEDTGDAMPCYEEECVYEPMCVADRCYVDEDCPEAFHCEFYWDEPMPDAGNASGGAAMVAPEGYCVEDPEPWLCSSDEDCPAGYHCEFPWDATPVDCVDEDGAGCLVPWPEGICVEDPPPLECYSDEDCPEGSHCELDEICPPCVHGDPACDMPCWVEGVCVEDEPQECRTHDDCPEGQVCELNETCPPCVYDDPPCEVACEPTGVCVDPPLCAAVDCAPGYRCEVVIECYDPCDFPGCEWTCEEFAVCVADDDVVPLDG